MNSKGFGILLERVTIDRLTRICIRVFLFTFIRVKIGQSYPDGILSHRRELAIALF